MKKVLCTLLVAAMVMSLLVGCGTKEPAEPTTQEPAKEETKKEEAPKEEVKEEVKEEAKEEAPAEWSEEDWLPLSDSNEPLIIGKSQSSKIPDYDENELTKWLEAQTGIDIQFSFFTGSSGERQQQMALMAASGETLPDVLMLTMSQQFKNEMGQDGYFIDMSPYIGNMEYTPYMTQAINKLDEATYKRVMNFVTDPATGGIYSTPWASRLLAWDDIQTIGWINQKWLDNLGLKKPTNITELHDVLVAFRDKDPNGNGKKDEIPMIGNNSGGGAIMTAYVINAYVYMDFQNHFNATNGEVWTPWTSDEYREAVKTLHSWYEEGLIAQQCFTGISSTDCKPIFTPEDGVAVAGVICGHSSVYMTAESPVFYEYEILPTIYDGETEKGGYQVQRTGVVYDGYSITADCKNPELAMKFLDFMYKDEVVASFRHGIKGVSWDWIDPDADDNTNNIKILDEGQAFFEGIGTWCGTVNCVFTHRNFMNGGALGTEWLQREYDIAYGLIDGMLTAKVPDEIVRDFNFTAEEQEAYNSMKQVFTDYVLESLGKFGTGVWDPNNDADWNTYLSELKTMGLEEYTATVQAGYSRYMEN